MTRSPFPSGVAFVERWDPSLDPETFPMLLDGEAETILAATPTRRAEFAWGRWCARQALATLGEPAVAILSGPRREPLWPVGTVGSITHCRGYVAAAAARRPDALGLGLDAEPLAALNATDASSFLTPGEQNGLSQQHRPHAALVYFSAKEAVFKATYPTCVTEIDFLHVELDLDWRTESFRARLVDGGSACVAAAVRDIFGRIHITDTHVVTGVVLPARSADPASESSDPHPRSPPYRPARAISR